MPLDNDKAKSTNLNVFINHFGPELSLSSFYQTWIEGLCFLESWSTLRKWLDYLFFFCHSIRQGDEGVLYWVALRLSFTYS